MPLKGKRSKLKTALILSGGGSLGAFEIGALKVILKKIIPDVIIGTSIGSINGTFVALGYPLEKLETYWRSMKKKNIFPLNKEIFCQKEIFLNTQEYH